MNWNSFPNSCVRLFMEKGTVMISNTKRRELQPAFCDASAARVESFRRSSLPLTPEL